MAAAARVETEIEPALAGTAVRELDECRRLETASEVAVNAGARVQLENQAGHGSGAAVRLGPAVVAVGQKGIPGAELHGSRAHPGVRRPPVRRLSFGHRHAAV